jgi:hypothetical protein
MLCCNAKCHYTDFSFPVVVPFSKPLRSGQTTLQQWPSRIWKQEHNNKTRLSDADCSLCSVTFFTVILGVIMLSFIILLVVVVFSRPWRFGLTAA